MDDSLETFVPLTFRRRGARRVAADDRHVHDVTLLEGVARGFYWQHLVDTGEMQSGSAIARAEKLHHSVVNELLRLTLLAPDIIEQFMAGKQPRRLTLMWFQRNRLMVDWQAQRQLMATFEEDV
jgi:hypothetical protein